MRRDNIEGCAISIFYPVFAHSYVHLTSNPVLLRFKLFVLSHLLLLILGGLVLLGIWQR